MWPSRGHLDRAREHLAVGEVLMAVRVHPQAPGDVDREVGVLAEDAQLAHLLEPLGDLCLAGRLRLPEGDRVRVEQVAGRVDEVLPLGQRHARVLGGGVAGEGGAAPAHVALRLALEEALEERSGRCRADRLAVGGRCRSRSGCCAGPRCSAPAWAPRSRSRPAGSRRAAAPRPPRPGTRPATRSSARAHHRVGAELGHLAHQLDEQGLGERRAVDQDGVALTDLERVAAQQIRQRCQSRVAHRSRMLAPARCQR